MRTSIQPGRGTYCALEANLDTIQENELVFATDQQRLYVKRGGVLVGVSMPDGFTDAPADGTPYVRMNNEWVPVADILDSFGIPTSGPGFLVEE